MRPFSIVSLGKVLLVSVAEEIDDSGVLRLRETVRVRAADHTVRGVIADLRDLEVVDSYLASALQLLARTLKLQNAELVVAGLSAPVIMTLLDFDIQFPDVLFAMDVEQALEKLGRRLAPSEERDDRI